MLSERRQIVSEAERWAIWTFVALSALVVAASIFAAPFLASRRAGFAAYLIYSAFARVCHQLPERSFHLWQHQLAVCARCTGIYIGFACGAAIYPLGRAGWRMPHRRWLILAAGPMVIDWALGFTGLWENTHLSRAITGALFGVVAAFYLTPGLQDFWATLKLLRRERASTYHQPSR